MLVLGTAGISIEPSEQTRPENYNVSALFTCQSTMCNLQINGRDGENFSFVELNTLQDLRDSTCLLQIIFHPGAPSGVYRIVCTDEDGNPAVAFFNVTSIETGQLAL